MTLSLQGNTYLLSDLRSMLFQSPMGEHYNTFITLLHADLAATIGIQPERIVVELDTASLLALYENPQTNSFDVIVILLAPTVCFSLSLLSSPSVLELAIRLTELN